MVGARPGDHDIRATNCRQLAHDQPSDGGNFVSACVAHSIASLLAASRTLRRLLALGPSTASSVRPVSKNSIQFSRRSFANTNTTSSKSDSWTPAALQCCQNLRFRASPSAMSSSTSAHTIRTVLPPIDRHAAISSGMRCIRLARPPHGLVRTTLDPVHGRSHDGFRALISA